MPEVRDVEEGKTNEMTVVVVVRDTVAVPPPLPPGPVAVTVGPAWVIVPPFVVTVGPTTVDGTITVVTPFDRTVVIRSEKIRSVVVTVVAVAGMKLMVITVLIP